MHKIKWANSAQESYQFFLKYLAEENLSAAKKWNQEFWHKLDILQKFPEIGSLNFFDIHGSRKFLIAPAWIIYDVSDYEVFILAFRHHSQVK